MILDFDIKELPNFKFSHSQLLEYYEEIVKEYQHLKWTPENTNQLSHSVSKMYSWAIQSNLKNVNKPCPPYDIKHDIETIGTFDQSTDLMFGFGKLIVDAIPQIRQTVISVHPPGTIIQDHIDNPEFLKIHIPITTDKDSYFVFENQSYNLEEGKAYLINTTRLHGTINKGESDRAHFIFKIPINVVEQILNNDWIFDSKKLNFEILELSNVSFNFNELQDYYINIVKNFNYLKWTMPWIKETNLGGLYGYGILTNKENIEEPCDPPGIRKDKDRYNALIKPTRMLHGFSKKLYDNIPYMEELVITGHPPKTGIPPHIDKDEHIRIHLPIFSNPQSFFIINGNRYILEPKKIYAVNTKLMHHTINEGPDDRIHLHFKIPIGKFYNFLNTEIRV